MSSGTQSWSIIVFCYNEDKTVGSVISTAYTLLKNASVQQFEIIVVDDGSTDNSISEIKKAQSDFPGIVKSVFHAQNKGIGFALRSGYNAAIYENICAVPADGQFDINEIAPHINVPEKTFVSFYRKENLQYSLFRNILSYFNKKINQYLIGVRLKDVNWVKIYKNKEIKSFKWKITSSLIESEICAKLLFKGNKVIEAISVYHPRKAGQSKGASWKVVRQAMKETFRLILIMLSFRRETRRYSEGD